MPSTGATLPHLSFGAPGPEMEVIMKGAVGNTEQAQGSLCLALQKISCCWLRTNMLYLPEEWLVGVTSLLHVFFAFISFGNITN